MRTAIFAAAGLFVLATVEDVRQHVVPGARADQYRSHANRRGHKRQARRDHGASSPEEIARYFQLYGGFIDPTINKQSQAGPFDSGFFFDSGIGPNGGDSPYMN